MIALQLGYPRRLFTGATLAVLDAMMTHPGGSVLQRPMRAPLAIGDGSVHPDAASSQQGAVVAHNAVLVETEATQPSTVVDGVGRSLPTMALPNCLCGQRQHTIPHAVQDGICAVGGGDSTAVVCHDGALFLGDRRCPGV